MTLIGFAEGQGPEDRRRDKADDPETLAELARLARRAQKDITLQAELFDPRSHLFGDAAWTIMLFLFEMACLNRPVSVTDACTAACAAPTTALRYILTLERIGYVERAPDPFDRRRSYLSLSDGARRKMRLYFEKSTLLR